MANSEYNLTVVDGTALTISLSGPVGPAGAGGGGTPAGGAGSVQYSNGTALVADSGLVYTGTGDLGTLKVGGGRIYMDATTGAIQANNVAIGGSNGVMPFANVAPAAGNVGSLNVSIGAGNFQAITTGQKNVACGSYSLTNVIDGQSNLAIGNNTLFHLENGYRNVALGSGAGGGITSGSDNIMIASAPADGTANCQIAIAGTPDGPSSTVIGYDGKGNEVPTTKTRFIGNTIIWGDGVVGQNSPTASPNNRTSLVQTSSGTAKTITLPNVTGKLPVYTDTPAEGKILTATDASGAATWQTPAGGTVEATIIDGSTNAVSGNAVFDALADKAPTANPTFTGASNFSGEIILNGASSSITTFGVGGFVSTDGNNADIFTNGTAASIHTGGINATIYTTGPNAEIYTGGANAHIQTRATFKLFNGNHTSTLSHNPTLNRAIAFPDASGTLPVVPAYVDSTAANAALDVDDFWWDTTLKKLRRATA